MSFFNQVREQDASSPEKAPPALQARCNCPILGTTTYTAAVNQSYTYGGKQGRASGRETSMTFNGGTTELFNQSWSWNDLGDVATVGYPQCAFSQYCTATQPRTVTSTYAHGFLTGSPASPPRSATTPTAR